MLTRTTIVTAFATVCLSCGSASYQRPPGSAPTDILQGSSINLGGAKPGDRGAAPPSGLPAVLVARTIEVPPGPVPVPPQSARDECSDWWVRWLNDLQSQARDPVLRSKNPYLTARDDGGWFSDTPDWPPPESGDPQWLVGELVRCAGKPRVANSGL